jgi:hypothetical protein
VSSVQRALQRGACSIGGILGYPSARLYEEVAFIAFHFHWSQDDILNLEHADRQRWVSHISRINQQVEGSSIDTENSWNVQ